MSSGGAGRAVVAALAANVGIAVTKVLAWLLTGSSSLLAEAIHSFADSGNQVLLLLGAERSKRAPSPRHPFGYGRERYVYAFLVSIVLFSLGGLFALYEAYHKFQGLDAPHTSGDTLLTSRWKLVPLVVLSAAMVMEGLSFRTAMRESRQSKGTGSWFAFIRQAKAPELPVVLLEDFAALVGLALALVGVGLSLLTQDLLWDVLGTGAIGVLLVAVALTLGIETKSLLLGEAATPADQARIEEALRGDARVLDVFHVRTLHLGPEEVLVACKISVAPAASAREVSAVINGAEERIRSAVSDVTLIYVEPDILDTRIDPGPAGTPPA